jgi:hypothetical protein
MQLPQNCAGVAAVGSPVGTDVARATEDARRPNGLGLCREWVRVAHLPVGHQPLVGRHVASHMHSNPHGPSQGMSSVRTECRHPMRI